MRHPGKPFRWNVANPKLTQRLGNGESETLPDYQIDRLLRTAASSLRSGDFDFVFVGRSLESVFDLLSGALARTTWYDRVQQLQISTRGNESILDLRDQYLASCRRWLRKPRDFVPFGQQLDTFRSYLEYSQLSPEKIISRPRPIAFVDVVRKGTTFGLLWELLQFFHESPNDAETMRLRERIHWVAVLPALTERDVDKPWHVSHSSWTEAFPNSIHCVTLDADLWCHLADSQFKTTFGHDVKSWGANDQPPECESPLGVLNDALYAAARGARECYRRGERSRKRLAALLDEAPEPLDCVKQLARELRNEAKHY